jgi:hypothetical protein
MQSGRTYRRGRRSVIRGVSGPHMRVCLALDPPHEDERHHEAQQAESYGSGVHGDHDGTNEQHKDGPQRWKVVPSTLAW